jgi:hypothetical protein
MAFKMKGFTPYTKKDGFFRTTWNEIKETFRTGDDSHERRNKGRRHANLMNSRNRSDEAIAYRESQKNKV